MSSFFGNFHLTDPLTILRIACGAFFIPHIVGKFFVPAALEFFVAAGFKPARNWMYFAGAVEVALALGLILGVLLPYVAAIAALHLIVAAVSVYRVAASRRALTRAVSDDLPHAW